MNDWERQLLGLPLPEQIDGIVFIFIALAVLLVLVLWVLLPFAVFGVKQRLDKSNKINQAILDKLTLITNNIDKTTIDAAGSIKNDSSGNRRQ